MNDKTAENMIFAEPFDNLIYAILLQAAHDTKSAVDERDRKSAALFLQGDGRTMWEYLKTKPTYRRSKRYYDYEKNRNR